MKGKGKTILTLIIGILIGAVISVGVIFAYVQIRYSDVIDQINTMSEEGVTGETPDGDFEGDGQMPSGGDFDGESGSAPDGEMPSDGDFSGEAPDGGSGGGSDESSDSDSSADAGSSESSAG